jgi:hypothetical protein
MTTLKSRKPEVIEPISTKKSLQELVTLIQTSVNQMQLNGHLSDSSMETFLHGVFITLIKMGEIGHFSFRPGNILSGTIVVDIYINTAASHLTMYTLAIRTQ